MRRQKALKIIYQSASLPMMSNPAIAIQLIVVDFITFYTKWVKVLTMYTKTGKLDFSVVVCLKHCKNKGG